MPRWTERHKTRSALCAKHLQHLIRNDISRLESKMSELIPLLKIEPFISISEPTVCENFDIKDDVCLSADVFIKIALI